MGQLLDISLDNPNVASIYEGDFVKMEGTFLQVSRYNSEVIYNFKALQAHLTIQSSLGNGSYNKVTFDVHPEPLLIQPLEKEEPSRCFT